MGAFRIWLLSLRTAGPPDFPQGWPLPPRGGEMLSGQSRRDGPGSSQVCRFGHNLPVFGMVEKTGPIREFCTCCLFLIAVSSFLGTASSAFQFIQASWEINPLLPHPSLPGMESSPSPAFSRDSLHQGDAYVQ